MSHDHDPQTTLEVIATEFNPARDMRHHTRIAQSMTKENDSVRAAVKPVAVFWLLSAKHLCRGSLIGSALGALSSAAAGYDIREGAYTGMIAGMKADVAQYWFRGCVIYRQRLDELYPD